MLDQHKEEREKVEKIREFVNDPKWVYVEELLNEFIVELNSLKGLDLNRSNDEIAVEVKGRKLSEDKLLAFLNATGILKGRDEKETNKRPFK